MPFTILFSNFLVSTADMLSIPLMCAIAISIFVGSYNVIAGNNQIVLRLPAVFELNAAHIKIITDAQLKRRLVLTGILCVVNSCFEACEAETCVNPANQ